MSRVEDRLGRMVGKAIINGDDIGLHTLHVPVRIAGSTDYLQIKGERGRQDFRGLKLELKAYDPNLPPADLTEERKRYLAEKAEELAKSFYLRGRGNTSG